VEVTVDISEIAHTLIMRVRTVLSELHGTRDEELRRLIAYAKACVAGHSCIGDQSDIVAKLVYEFELDDPTGNLDESVAAIIVDWAKLNDV
jgi:hypothetical protein